MRVTTLVSLMCVAGVLTGCASVAAMNPFGSRGPGQTVEFVSANPDSVLLDFGARPPGELAMANNAAMQECQIFHKNSAILESLNVRTDGQIRATYLCKR